MLGLQTGRSLLENTAHRIERAKDHDSISGLCRIDCGLQCLLGIGMQAGRHLAAPSGHDLQGVPFLLQSSSALGAASDLNDQIAIWVNEGGAGGEVDR